MWVSEPDSILRGNGKVFEKDEHEVSDDVEVIPTGVSDDVEVVPTRKSRNRTTWKSSLPL
jgi:hypothetical protein